MLSKFSVLVCGVVFSATTFPSNFINISATTKKESNFIEKVSFAKMPLSKEDGYYVKDFADFYQRNYA